MAAPARRVRATYAARPGTGFSLVELLVGMALGLFVVAAAIGVLTSHLQENRALVIEARVMNELRHAADRITRELRRAGYWGEAGAALWQGDTAPRANPYLALGLVGEAASSVNFGYSRDSRENHTLDSNEQFGFRLRSGNLEVRLGSAWQTLTDPATLVVTAFSVTPQVLEQTLESLCRQPCPTDPAVADCPPRLQVRRLDLQISGRAAADARVVRSLQSSVRLRNDTLTGACVE